MVEQVGDNDIVTISYQQMTAQSLLRAEAKLAFFFRKG